MIKLPDFLLFLEKITYYDKSDIDRGDTPPEIYNICSSIRTTFCTSYGIKKNNDLYIYFQQENVLIKFNGKKLKYLGPDERSQALLLKKALNNVNEEDNMKKEEWIESTPGIYVRILNSNFSFLSFLNSFNKSQLTFVCESITPFDVNFLYHYFDYPQFKKFHRLKNLNKCFFIVPSSKNLIINLLREIVNHFPAMLEFITITILTKIKTMADKILYINFQIDRMGN